MKRIVIVSAGMLLALAGAVGAEEITCKGNIISKQGEGLVARTYRFEVDGVSGSDLPAILEKCGKIARDRQGRAARKNPGGNFRKASDVDLECVRGAETFSVRRTITTVP